MSYSPSSVGGVGGGGGKGEIGGWWTSFEFICAIGGSFRVSLGSGSTFFNKQPFESSSLISVFSTVSQEKSFFCCAKLSVFNIL